MVLSTFTWHLDKLPPRKGNYFYIKVNKEEVEQFPKKRATRLVCKLDATVSYSCGLNHLGDGNFFVILNKANVAKLGKSIGDPIHVVLAEDPNPLGVAVPEVLEALLEQDEHAKEIYDKISDGKKRNLIFTIVKIKNIDLQVKRSLEILNEHGEKMK